MQNLEFKAELKDPVLARSICVAIGGVFVGTLAQTDTYFHHPEGRLKRREVPGEPVEWILYERADRAGPKVSRFSIYTDAEARERFDTGSLRQRIVVTKTRDLFMRGTVRIHIDKVEDLGWFIEFEALVSPRTTIPRCEQAIAELRRHLAPALGEPIAAGYADLLAPE